MRIASDTVRDAGHLLEHGSRRAAQVQCHHLEGPAEVHDLVNFGGSLFWAWYYPPEYGSWLSQQTLEVTAPWPTDISVSVTQGPVSVNDTEFVITANTTRYRYDGSVGQCASGTLTFTDTVAGRSTRLGTAPAGCRSRFGTRFATPGTHVIEVAYGGNESQAPASTTITVEVGPDIALRASSVGRDQATFYPVKDRYLDTLVIRGTRAEPISVGIRITNAAGHVVRSWSRASAVGSYRVAWNGRMVSGALVAAGRYKIVQTLRDRAGHTRTYTTYTTISHKRLMWYTKTVTRNGDAYNDSGHTSLATVTKARSSYARGVQLRANRANEWAAARWDFTLPAAAKYGKLKFEVLGAAEAGYGQGYFGLVSKDVGGSSAWLRRSHRWSSISKPSAGHVYGRRVSGVVAVMGENLGRHDIAKVRLTYKYAVLR